MADCSRENSRDKLDLLFVGGKDKFKERDPEENERLRKALGLKEKFFDRIIKSPPWEQLGIRSWLFKEELPYFSPENRDFRKPPPKGNSQNLIMSMFGCAQDSFVPAHSVYL